MKRFIIGALAAVLLLKYRPWEKWEEWDEYTPEDILLSVIIGVLIVVLILLTAFLIVAVVFVCKRMIIVY